MWSCYTCWGRMRFIFLFAMIVLGATFNASAAGGRLYSDCNIVGPDEAPLFECAFRSREPKVVKRAELSVNGQPVSGASYSSFLDGDGKAAWLFLIDRSNPRRAATVKRSVELVSDLYAQANARNIMAVATFAGDMQMHISPGDPYADVAQRLAGVTADGAATAFYLSAIQAIEVLEGVDAQRRALVIISDGKAEDTAYGHGDVVDRARAAGVVIYGIGFAERASETVDLQQVERLASETGGPFVSAVGDAPLPRNFLANFTRYLTNGGSVSAPAGDLVGELTTRLDIAYEDGTAQQSDTFNLYIERPEPVVEVIEPAPEPEPEPEPEPAPLPLIAKIYQSFEGIWPAASQWALANQAVAWLLLVAPFVLLAMLALVLLKRSREEAGGPAADLQNAEPEEEAPITEVLSGDDLRTTVLANGSVNAGMMIGAFEPLDGGPRFEIREQNVTIGRHSENDFQLDDETVHRHHAVFHISPDGHPVITDLDTVNGVTVNGERVSKAELKSGDVVALGEAQFRFVEGG